MRDRTGPPVAMTIAGSDSGGGAGLQADLKTFASLGVFGTCAITSVTAQNSAEVRGVHPVPAAFVRLQVETVLDDLPVAAVKTGMLGTAEVVRVVAALAAEGRLPHLVVDPVMLSSSGAPLLEPAGEQAYRELLLPQAQVLTPNLLEARVLLDAEITTLVQQREAARALAELGPQVVVVKGGHAVQGTGGEAVDVVWDGASLSELRGPRVDTANDHGTGCTFAASLTASLARGEEIGTAVRSAKAYVARALAGGARWHLGAGHGPLDQGLWEEGPTRALSPSP